MTPELQKMMNAQLDASQQVADVAAYFKFLAYSSYAALIICAIFSVLIFWKLCQIQKQLFANSQSWRSKPSSPANPFGNEPTPPPGTESQIHNDSRFMPKQ